MSYEQLKLKNQLCFPVYAASRLIIREYKPYLDALNLTYPQYLVLMILWEEDCHPVNDIAKRLILNTNTMTPLLQRMEKQGLVKRQRSSEDERKVIVCLTDEGRKMQEDAVKIPEMLANGLVNGPLSLDEVLKLKQDLDTIIEMLDKK